jgi:hypothetical protein
MEGEATTSVQAMAEYQVFPDLAEQRSFSSVHAPADDSSFVASDHTEEPAPDSANGASTTGPDGTGSMDLDFFSSLRVGRLNDDAEAKEKAVQALLRARLAEGDKEFSLAVRGNPNNV